MSAWTKAPFAVTQAVLGAGLLAVAVPAPAQAQVDQRLERIERQLGALQRAVFPGGDERYFEPEITPQGNAATSTPQQPATSALTDMLARLDAIEQQLARLTAATEVNQNALSALEMRVVAMEESGTAMAAAESANGTNSGSGSSAGSSGATGSASTGVIPVPADGGRAEVPVNADVQAAQGPTPERLAGVQAIAKPATGDAGDDEYVYGFRLWDAGFYPEAQQQLALFVEQYPTHWRTSYGRNLLGRAFLDAGDPRTAATHFLANYNADKQGARAPHSLLYLAESMIAIEDTRRACIALSVFGDEYAALAAGELAGQYGGLSGRVDCD